MAPPTKCCRECGRDKRLDDFPLQRGGALGRHSLCKVCRAEQERRRYQQSRLEILERARVDVRRKRRVRWRALQRKYGLSKHEFELIFVAQRGCCAICELRPALLVVDHDHGTGCVRGLLCGNCNFALGELEDHPERFTNATDYLEAAPPLRGQQ